MQKPTRFSDSTTRPIMPAAGDRQRRFLDANDIARYCGVAREEVLAWIDSGVLKAVYLPHGRYRVNAQDFVAFVDRFDIPI